MKTNQTPPAPEGGSLTRLVRRLDAAHAELVEARKIAALSQHQSYEEIGDAIECVEAAFVWLHNAENITRPRLRCTCGRTILAEDMVKGMCYCGKPNSFILRGFRFSPCYSGVPGNSF
jgi:hypothetical protein